MELSHIKNILIFPQKKTFLISSQKKAFLIFQKWNPALFTLSSKNKRNSPQENFLCFRKRKPEKISYISCVLGKGNPEIFFIYQEVTCKA